MLFKDGRLARLVTGRSSIILRQGVIKIPMTIITINDGTDCQF